MVDRWLVAWGLGSVALGGASLLVPLYVVALGGGALALGALAALAALAGVPGALVAGRVADRTGRRRAFVVGPLAVVGAVLLVLPALDQVAVVVLANAVVWLAFAAAAPAVNLLAVAGAAEREWSTRLARLNTYQGYGWAGGLVLGMAWTGFGVRLVDPVTVQRGFFLVCGAAALGGALATARWLPPEPPTAAVRPRALAEAMRRATRTGVRGATFPLWPGRLYWSTRRLAPGRVVERFTRPLVTFYVAVALSFAGFAAFFAPLPLFLTDAGFASGEVFGLYLLASLASAVFYGAAGRIAASHDVALLNAAGLGVRAVALPAVAVVAAGALVGFVGFVATGGVFVVIGLTWAVIAVTAATLVTQLAPTALRGEALGVYVALTALAGGLGSAAGGWLAARSYLLAFGAAGGLVLAGATLVVFLRGATGAVDAAEPASVD